MHKIKIAQIGTNGYSHGRHIWNSLKKQSDIFDVAGYAFPENEREKFPHLMHPVLQVPSSHISYLLHIHCHQQRFLLDLLRDQR